MSDDPPLSVRRLEQGRFLVKSQNPRSDDWYLVELDDPKFPNGRCSCVDNDVRVEYYINRGEPPMKPCCKHCRRVRAELQHAATLCRAAGIEFDERILRPA